MLLLCEHGRSENGNRCRHCGSEIETLSHILGFCRHGELLRNSRHHVIRTAIADEFRKQKWEVAEEVHGLSEDGSNRRIDIIVINPVTREGYILDPTVRFERDKGQAEEVDAEKRNIYEATVPYFKTKYDARKLSVVGLFVGARGTITSFFKAFCKKFNLDNLFIDRISMLALKGSISILRYHLYGQ